MAECSYIPVEIVGRIQCVYAFLIFAGIFSTIFGNSILAALLGRNQGLARVLSLIFTVVIVMMFLSFNSSLTPATNYTYTECTNLFNAPIP